MSESLQPHGLEFTRLLCPWDYPGKHTGVGFHFLLQEIFPTQGLNPGLLHCKQMLSHLSHQGSPIFREGCKSPNQKWEGYLLGSKQAGPLAGKVSCYW